MARDKQANRKTMIIRGQDLKVQWVGPAKPNNKWACYIRFEDRQGNYLGAIDGRQLATLRKWLSP